MAKLKRILKKIFRPPVPIAVIAVICAAVAMASVVFGTGGNCGIIRYFAYVAFAYALIVVVIAAVTAGKRITEKVKGTKIWQKYFGAPQSKIKTGLYQGTFVNLIYAAFRLITGILFSSVWFVSMAVYYLVLGCMKIFLLVWYGKAESMRGTDRLVYEYNRYSETARLLLLLDVPMSGMILLMIVTDAGYSYPGYIIYVSAIYTFYMAVISVVNIVKTRRLGSPIFSAAKVLNLTSAMMSVLGLQTAMIATFSAASKGFGKVMNAVTGGIVGVAVVAIAVYMTVYSYRAKKRLFSSGDGNEQIGK